MDAMDFIKKYLATIRAQLMGLTLSQKILIGLLILVMVVTIFYVVASSAKPDMVVLIPQSMTAEEINRVEMYLKGKYAYQTKGDSIMVPAEKAYAIRGELFAAQALPKDTTAAFTALVAANSMFETDGQQGRKWNLAMQETLTKMLRYFPYIDDGTVIISRGEKSGLGRDSIPSSASVAVKVRNNEGLTGTQVVAIVDMIRGSVPGLKREDVHITDGQRVYHAPSSDSVMPADLLAYKKSIEDDLTRKLWTMFGDVGNVKIAVNVVPDMSDRRRNEELYDPKNKISLLKTEGNHETTTSDTTAVRGSEPGVKPNVSLTNADSTGGGNRSTSSNTDVKNEYQNYVSKILQTTALPPGTDIKEMTASISLPRSYFLAIYRSRIAKDQKAEPEDEKLQPIIDAQIKIAQARAKNSIGAKNDEQIRVDWFDDTITLHNIEAAGVGGLGSAGSITTMISQYAKQAVLGVIALGVLGMMLMMVRRAVPTGAAGTEIDPSVFFGGTGTSSGGGGRPRRKNDGGAFDVGEDVFGEAGEGSAVLTGIELDDETLQSRKMVDEVSTMIKENPENAAALVKRWISKNK